MRLKLDRRPTTAVFGNYHRLSDGTTKGGSIIRVVGPESGKSSRTASTIPATGGKPGNGPNDLVFERCRRFLVKPISARTRGRSAETTIRRRRLTTPGPTGLEDREQVFPLERPTGCGLSPDGKTSYVVETPTARCMGFEPSPRPGVNQGTNGPYRGEEGPGDRGPGRATRCLRFARRRISGGTISASPR